MSIQPPTPLGCALANAVRGVRDEVGRSDAPVVVITPYEANATLARQQLALAGSFIRVDFLTPERMLQALARRCLLEQKLRRPPSGWLTATIITLLHELARAGQLQAQIKTLSQPGWLPSLARAVETLELAGVEADQLRRTEAPGYADRLAVLAELLRGVEHQRAVDRLYSSTDLTNIAMEELEHGRSPWSAAVILGDRLLAPQTYDVIRAWNRDHPHVEVCPEPWHNLEPAPSGLRSTVHASEPVVVQLARGTLLAELAQGLFSAPTRALEHDNSVTLARTPDDVRELAEVTRVVLDAIRGGVPLDRIAVVLPDAEHVVVLREHFERLEVPATWLIGPPLSTTPAARFLLSCLELADGGDTVPAWYDLLRLPGLRLGPALSPTVTTGRGRWRRILARCGAVCDTQTIIGAVQTWAAELPDDDTHESDPDRDAATNLVRALQALHATFLLFSKAAPLGAHARRWIELLRRWWTPSPDLAQLTGLLRGWGPPGVGCSVSPPEALAQLRHDLQTSAALKGRLADPAVRVMTPMNLLGGAFEVVVVSGMTEGRFPRRPGEDPILPDELLEQLNASLRIDLLPSHKLRDYEIRRFGAVVGACTKQLWLSSPATDLLDARPLLSSVFLLETASTLLGRRATYADLRGLQLRSGSRAESWSPNPEHAISSLEHQIASTVATPRSSLARLASQDSTRRLLGLQRALDSDIATSWTGKLSPGLLPTPGLDGSPLDPRKIAKLIANPGAFLVEEVLEIRRPATLRGHFDPLRPAFRDQLFLSALEDALDAPGPTHAAFEAAWESAIERWRRHRGDIISDETLALLRGLRQQRFSKLERLGVLPNGAREVVRGPVVEGLPWQIEARVGWRQGPLLTGLLLQKPAKKQFASSAPELVLAAMVQPGVSNIYAVDIDANWIEGDLPFESSTLARRLTLATRCITQLNCWPWGHEHALRLSSEHDLGYRSGECEAPPPRKPT
ncbi:hypothetical protein G6O69_23845 [Pseudenhygromyxa sp. WMMC2535]|uniref:hypothetical protein n=1 Tax=Pseudenhygromyxa sp. WMMC2535 TaxID=2712867 RepID=UPI0015543CEE|nr:hypothetical protein [Pseudenhygromyxa sp. WMMC2535]NVB40893.1 hypothetical protein [Pseudenhygromyxa sp. WMMC2535]